MMKTYKVKFSGRKIGALGVSYVMHTTVKADSVEDARLKLYENYDHISLLSCESLEEDEGSNED